MHAPDKKCALCRPEDLVIVMVKMIYDEHSAGPLDGFDLRSIPPSDSYLVNLAMSAFKIDRDAPDARQQLNRALRRKRRRGRTGRHPTALRVAVAMELEGVTPSDTAPTIANRIAPYFPNLTEASLVQKVQRWQRSRRAGASSGRMAHNGCSDACRGCTSAENL